MLGILLIDKPRGITSHDVVNVVRRRLGTKRVGHAGTLDPIATGLLVVAVGPATRFLQYLPLEPKVYVAEIRFGQASTTFDTEGDLTELVPPPVDLAGAAREHLPAFRGLIQQLPPMFSAVKINGQPLYKYARQGQDVKREPRTVHITDFSILHSEGDTITARIACSGGTYVRSLAHELGQAIGCGAHLTGLVRHDVGRFSLDQAHPLDEVEPAHLISLADALPPMPLLQLDEMKTLQVREGRPIGIFDAPASNLAGLLEPGGTVFSIARVQGNLLQPECVIPAEVAHGAV